jgi:two-component system, NarL family, sensor histidine kinase DesK
MHTKPALFAGAACAASQ